MKADDTIDDLIKLLDYLTVYVYDHFMAEELAMARNNYPDYIKHKQQHTSFINTVADLEERMPNEMNLNSFKEEVNEKMVDWLSNHILVQDKEMANFIQNHEHLSNKTVNNAPITKS